MREVQIPTTIDVVCHTVNAAQIDQSFALDAIEAQRSAQMGSATAAMSGSPEPLKSAIPTGLSQRFL